jgi:lipopolysaccharide transport system ATP-binding protein
MALKNISFEVAQGEVMGIIGRNGAGKSTLLKILSRVTGPTKGAISIRGRIASLLEVGTGFHPELSGRENIFLNGAILGMKKLEIKKHFDAIVDFAEIAKFIDTPVKRYSSGMYVRLAFAVAAHLEPEILIVDEVLAVGDAEFQKKCLAKMGAVSQQQGRTILFVSHNLSAIRALCTKGMLLNSGMLEAIGEIDDVVGKYTAIGIKSAHVKYAEDPTKEIQIRSVTILKPTGEPSSYLDLKDSFSIKTEYEVKESLAGVGVCVNIFSMHNECLIATCDFDQDKTRLRMREPGIYTSSVTVPGYILNSGIFQLVIGISMPGKVIYDRQEVTQFEIFDSGSFVVEGGGELRRNSVLLLPLRWTPPLLKETI